MKHAPKLKLGTILSNVRSFMRTQKRKIAEKLLKKYTLENYKVYFEDLEK